MNKRTFCALIVTLAGSSVAMASFGVGTLVVSRVGDGSAALTSVGTAGFLDEFNTSGSGQTALQTIALPTTASGSNFSMVYSGSATSDGALTLSSDGRYLTMTGYGGALGQTGIASAAVDRVIGRIGFDGVVDSSTRITDGFTGNNVRSAASVDGSAFWVGGAGTGGGVRYVQYGQSTSTQLATDLTNVRVVNIFGGQVYASSASGTFHGVNTVGTGLSTTSGQTTTHLAGFPTSGSDSNYDYFLANSTTLYVADDRSAASGGGIEKWTFSGSTWSLAYTLALGTTTAGGARGLTGLVDGLGNVTLYATTTVTNANRLVSITDTGASSVFTTLATAATNEAFRGVDFAPVPTPGSLLLMSFGAAASFRRRR